MFKKQSINITEGPILSAMIIFMVPTVLSGILQQLFQAADGAVLAQMGDLSAVAALNAVTPVISLIVSSLVGLSEGAVILLAQAYGKKDDADCEKLLINAMLLSGGIGIFCVLLGLIFGNYLPAIAACPTDCYNGAVTYIRIYFCAAPAILFFNFGAAALRASGDSRRPALYLIYAGVLNLLLNVLFCLTFEDKVFAVGLATLLSQALAAFLSIARIFRVNPALPEKILHSRLSLETVGRILKTGIPCALTQALFSLGNLPVMRALNGFGETAIAGNGASIRLEWFPAEFCNAVAATTLTFVGQNYGARDMNRVKKSLHAGILIGFVSTVTLSVVLVAFREPLLNLFIVDENRTETYRVALLKFMYIIPLYFVQGVRRPIDAATQGLSYTLPSTIANLCSVLILRILWVAFIFPRFPVVENLFLCFIVSWFVNFFFTVVFWFIAKRKAAEKLCLSE